MSLTSFFITEVFLMFVVFCRFCCVWFFVSFCCRILSCLKCSESDVNVVYVFIDLDLLFLGSESESDAVVVLTVFYKL